MLADELGFRQDEAEVAGGLDPGLKMLPHRRDPLLMLWGIDQVRHLPWIGRGIVELLGRPALRGHLPLLWRLGAGLFEGVEIEGHRNPLAIGVAN